MIRGCVQKALAALPRKAVWQGFGLALTSFAGGLPSIARADYPVPLVQVTCARTLHYASVRRLIVENAPGYRARSPDTAAQRAAEQDDHIYGPGRLAGDPVRCEIPASMTREGERSAVSVTVRADKDGTVEVLSGGAPVGRIRTDLRGQETGLDSVEVFANGVGVSERTCAYGAGEGGSLTCRTQDRPGKPPQ